MVVDHISGDTLDNRKENLRICTPLDNGKNRKVSIRNTSGFVGVQFRELTHRWEAMITTNGKRIRLGGFLDINDAIAARKAAEELYFGEFSPRREKLN